MTNFSLAIGVTEKDNEGYYDVYIVNNSPKQYSDVRMRSGGYFSTDEGVVNTAIVEKSFEVIGPFSAFYIDHMDYLERDMEIWYEISMEDSEGVREEYTFNMPKWAVGEGINMVPFLDKKGWIVDLTSK